MKTVSKILILISALCAWVYFFPAPSFAAKPRVINRTTTVVKTRSTGGIAYSTAKLNRTTNSVVVTFLNQDKVSRIDYTLSYTGSGLAQGVGGSITSSGSNASRDLYFGTCSKGVCTPHRNIRNATLSVMTTLKSGATHTKRYRIKV